VTQSKTIDGSVRWGIAGTGGIAGVFAYAMRAVEGGRVVAVGSRTSESAERFAGRFAIPVAHASYAALVADPEVDAIYVASPHAQHLDLAVMSLEAGKHVLCEKPMTLSAQQSARLVEIAREHGRFLMEALWSRFLPAYRAIEGVVVSGEIGDVLAVEASFGFRAAFDPAHRLFARELGGGALLDLGIYPVHLAHFVLGVPTAVRASAHIGTTGVDEQTVVSMEFASGALAIAHAAITAKLPGTARVTGTEGAIEIPAAMHHPQHLDVVRFDNDERRRIDTPSGDAPFRFQIEEVHKCLAAGLTESGVMPLADSLAIAATLDRARSDIGLDYPGE
jgi:predicted dehydrogenase